MPSRPEGTPKEEPFFRWVASTQIAILRLPSIRKVWFGNSVRGTTPLSASASASVTLKQSAP